MKTSELLEHITGPMLDDRADLVSGVSDELFKDTTVLRHLNEAQRIMCRRAWVLEDLTTAAICQIQMLLDTQDYALHRTILHVKSARLSDSDIDLGRVGYNDNHLYANSYHVDPDFWDQNAITTENSGRPQRYSVDMGTRVLRVRRKPDATAALLTLNMNVVRLPLTTLDPGTDPNSEPEIPEEHHLDLTLYAAGMCLTTTADVDASLRALGRDWLSQFDDKVTAAKRDRQRRQQAMPQFRFSRWGSG